MRTEHKFNALLYVFAPTVRFPEHVGYLHSHTKTLVIVYATHFTAPKSEPGLLNFLSSKAGVMG